MRNLSPAKTKAKVKAFRFKRQVLSAGLVFSLAMLFVFVSTFLTVISPRSSATSGDMGVNIEAALSVQLSTSNLLLTVANAEQQGSAHGVINLAVATNNITGYTAIINTSTLDTTLVHSNGTDKITNTANMVAGPLSVKTWGYNLGGNTSDFKQVPAFGTANTLASTDTNTAGDNLALNFGVNTDITLPAGIYTNELLFTVVANPTPAPDFVNWVGGDIYVTSEVANFTVDSSVSVAGSVCQSTKFISDSLIRCTLPSLTDHRIYDVLVKDDSSNTLAHQTVLYDGSIKGDMQAFAWEQCVGLERGQAQVWSDSRNMQTYRVKKMQDGKCWMIDNLRYEYGALTSSGYLTSDGTDTQSDNNSNVAKYANPGTAGNTSYCSAGSDLSTCYGYLYNWYGATYGTGLYHISSGDVAGNICPNSSAQGSTTATTNGWRLPKATNTATSDIGILNAGMAGDDGSTTNWVANNTNNNTDVDFKNNWYPTGPFQGTYSGSYGSGLVGRGHGGDYWSSTAVSAVNAYRLNFDSSAVYPALNANKIYGLALRCLVSEPENWTGGDIYVNGTGFTTGTTVSVGGTACQSTKYISANKLRCTLPSKSNGSINEVTVSEGTHSHPGVKYDGVNKGDMQEFRTEQCATMNRGQAQVWTDSRNSQTYRVKKMQDGKCWMIDNLRYAYGTEVSGTTTSVNTSAQYANPGTASSANYCSSGTNLSTCYGYLYNWFGATYGTGTASVSSGDVAGNICPNSASAGSTTATTNGWRLPKATNTATSDIGILNAGMAGDDGSTTNWTANNTGNTDVNFKNNWYPTGPYQGAYSGVYSSALVNLGGGGYYWSSAAGSDTNAHGLYFYPIYVYPAMGDYKAYGYALRCLVE